MFEGNRVYGTNESIRFIGANELERYFLGKEFMWRLIDDNSLRDLASRYKVTPSVMENGKCSFINNEGREASLFYCFIMNLEQI
jgi:hypothetical protein